MSKSLGARTKRKKKYKAKEKFKYDFITRLTMNIVTFINEAYSRGEQYMWKGHHNRTSFAEIWEYLQQDQIILAYPA